MIYCNFIECLSKNFLLYSQTFILQRADEGGECMDESVGFNENVQVQESAAVDSSSRSEESFDFVQIPNFMNLSQSEGTNLVDSLNSEALMHPESQDSIDIVTMQQSNGAVSISNTTEPSSGSNMISK